MMWCLSLLFCLIPSCVALTLNFASGEQQFTIRLHGEFVSTRQTSISGPPRINGPILSMKSPGTRLNTGDTILTIAAERAQRRLRREQRRLSQSRARLARLRQNQRNEKLKIELQILDKEFEVLIKDKEIEYGSGEKDADVLKNLELQIQLKKEQIVASREKLEIYEDLSDNSAVSDEEVTKARKNLAKLKAEKTQKDRELQLLQRGKPPEELKILEAEKTRLSQELQSLKEQLKESQATFALDQTKLELVIQKRQKEIEKKTAELKKATVKAPHPGTLTRAYDWMGPIGIGSKSWSGRRIAEVIDYSDITAKLMLPEKFIEHVQKGQSVILRPLTNPNRTLDGTVTRVESFARPINPRDRKSPKVHQVHVELGQTKHLIPGGNLRAELEVFSCQKCVAVPRYLGEKDGNNLFLNGHTYPLLSQSTDHWFVQSEKTLSYDF